MENQVPTITFSLSTYKGAKFQIDKQHQQWQVFVLLYISSDYSCSALFNCGYYYYSIIIQHLLTLYCILYLLPLNFTSRIIQSCNLCCLFWNLSDPLIRLITHLSSSLIGLIIGPVLKTHVKLLMYTLKYTNHFGFFWFSLLFKIKIMLWFWHKDVGRDEFRNSTYNNIMYVCAHSIKRALSCISPPTWTS